MGLGVWDGERLRDRVEKKWDSREIGAENEEINRRCQRLAGAWVGARQGLGLAASGGIEACNGKKWRVWGPSEGREEQWVEMGKEEKEKKRKILTIVWTQNKIIYIFF